MSRIAATLAAAKARGRTALIPYICCGDPYADATPDIMQALADGGADDIELGVPFSDPMADGPVIQRASERALARRIGKLPATDPMPAASFDEVVKNHMISPTLELDITKLLWLRDFLAEEGFIEPEFEPGTMIDRSARERALARIKGP